MNIAYTNKFMKNLLPNCVYLYGGEGDIMIDGVVLRRQCSDPTNTHIHTHTIRLLQDFGKFPQKDV